jgi:hypothetical protein
MKALKLVSAVGMALLGACGSSSASPVDACNQEVETECARVYECFTPAELAAANFPASESACITQFETSEGCAAKTSANFCTPSTAVYHGEAVDGCVSQVEALSCADLKSHLNDINTVAPKCAEVCVIPT